jgi:hypothetical protein
MTETSTPGSKTNLETKQAVKLAKEWAAGQFSEEGIEDIGLEEVRWSNGYWEITLGFSRRWDRMLLGGIGGLARPRTYKVVTISDADGSIVSLRNREAA